MAVLTVGPGGDYSTIEAAVQNAGSGDTIAVASGTYTNDFITITKNLTLEAVGGSVNLVATEPAPDGKAIIDEGAPGVSVTISGFDISGATDAAQNGAAIRYEAGSLTLDDDTIHGNQEGLLAGADPNGSVTIDNSVFDDNGDGSGYTHNIYVGAINTLTVENSTIEMALVGHDIKSAAATTTVVDNTIGDGPDGDSSYEIDLPHGGDALISGNTIEKGPDASNPVAISYGEAGNLYANGSLTIDDNTILNNYTAHIGTIVNDVSGTAATLTGNELYDWPVLVDGPSDISGNTVLTTEPAFDSNVPCFCAGTAILTTRGEVAVEALAVGDRVVTVSGKAKRICWIGRRSYTGRFVLGRPHLAPVVIRAGALGAGLPRRDLLVSPLHAMFIAGVLVPAGCLVNGTTIVRQRGGQAVDYVHVELRRHDVILAEGAPSETFLDDGSRGMFQNAAEFVARGPVPPSPGRYCAPRVESGYALEAIRRSLGAEMGAQAA